MDDYEVLERGNWYKHTCVCKARDRSTGRLVALKRKRVEDDEGVPSTTLREIALLRLLSESTHVVELLSVEQVMRNGLPTPGVFLVFEHLKTDLRQYMERACYKSALVPPKIVKILMYQLLRGVAHMHKHGAMHRDLTPQNLLVDDSSPLPVLKVADLSMARQYTIPTRAYTHEITTLWYRAPKVLLGATHYAPAVDVWSIGCIFAELAQNQPFFPGDSEVGQLFRIFQVLGTPSEEGWQGVTQLVDWHEYPDWRAQDLRKLLPALFTAGLDLLQQMLEYDPAKRITAKDAMQHDYFADLDFEVMPKQLRR